MKRVIIVGAGGYIGESLAAYAKNNHNVDVVDSFEGWKTANFGNYDGVLFAAGIVHRKQTSENKHLYYAVNRDLAIDVAKKAKLANVCQFIYLSSMSVYGKKQGEITQHTIPASSHNDYYGHSKFEAETALIKLNDENFKIAIIRPPMVYGENCPGKYAQLVKLSKFMPMVPDTKNKRSMIYIDNLSAFLCTIIERGSSGIFCPDNPQYTNTAELVKSIRQASGQKTMTSLFMGALVKVVMNFCPPLKNAFGS